MIEYETELPDGTPVTVQMKMVCDGDRGDYYQPPSEAEIECTLTDKNGNSIPSGEMTMLMLEDAERRWADDMEARRDMEADAKYEQMREEDYA